MIGPTRGRLIHPRSRARTYFVAAEYPARYEGCVGMSTSSSFGTKSTVGSFHTTRLAELPVVPVEPSRWGVAGMYIFGSDSEVEAFVESVDSGRWFVAVGEGNSRGTVVVMPWLVEG